MIEEPVCRTGRAGRINVTFTSEGYEFREGQVVFEYLGPTYGVLAQWEIPVCKEPREFPFIGIPRNSVEWDLA